jgi:CheY-like chemotaxis protein
VFEPFFTTKEAGRGSGLGLSIVHGFAAQSGGLVEIASTPGEGTKVDLWLPRAESKTSQCLAPDPAPSISEPSHARILVCDDDSGVLSFVATVLRDNGHIVWEAETPSEALAILEREQPLDLLLVDYAMPGMNAARSSVGRLCHAGNERRRRHRPGAGLSAGTERDTDVRTRRCASLGRRFGNPPSRKTVQGR